MDFNYQSRLSLPPSFRDGKYYDTKHYFQLPELSPNYYFFLLIFQQRFFEIFQFYYYCFIKSLFSNLTMYSYLSVTENLKKCNPTKVTSLLNLESNLVFSYSNPLSKKSRDSLANHLYKDIYDQ